MRLEYQSVIQIEIVLSNLIVLIIFLMLWQSHHVVCVKSLQNIPDWPSTEDDIKQKYLAIFIEIK